MPSPWNFGGSWAVVLLAAIGCGTQGQKAERPEIERLPRLETTLPEYNLLPIHIELTAVVAPWEQVNLCARIPGVVATWQIDANKPEVDIGRPVSTGEPLVQLAIPDLEAAKKYKQALLDQARRQKDQTREMQKVAEKALQEARQQEPRYQAEFELSQQ